MKKDQYFNLEVNLLNDDNIASMMSEMNAAEALGIYVILLLHLRTKDAYEEIELAGTSRIRSLRTG